MAVTLEITFTGLIALVPDPANTKLFALLPSTGPFGEHPVHQHHAALTYDRKRVTVTLAAAAGDAAAADPHEGHSQAASEKLSRGIIPLGRMQVRFPAETGSGAKITPPETAAPLPDYGKSAIDAKQVSDSPRGSVYAQVQLPGADDILPSPKKARWRVGSAGSKKHHLSHEFTWRRKYEAAEVTVEVRYFGESVWRKFTLKPNKGNTIEIGIEHVPQPEDDHKIDINDPAEHFMAYHALFLDPKIEDLPHLDEEPETVRVRDDESKVARSPTGANVFTCMTAQVPLGDG